MGSGAGSVSRAVESSHWQKIIFINFLTQYWKNEIKEKEAGNYKLNCLAKKCFNAVGGAHLVDLKISSLVWGSMSIDDPSKSH